LERVVAFSRADGSFLENVQSYFTKFLYVAIPISIVVSFVFLFGIWYCLFKLGKLKKELKLKFNSRKSDFGDIGLSPERVNERWHKILGYLESLNPGDWKLAILEADIMLEEMVDKMGYQGEGLGEKLKSIERSDFSTLDKAWEAHKIRNSVAHEGTKFYITQGEARRVIGLFHDVFKEFRYI